MTYKQNHINFNTFSVEGWRALHSPSRKLKDNVESDETFMGGFEPGKPRRSKGKKRAVKICIEVDYSESKTGKIKEAKAEVLEDCSSASLEGALDKMVEHGSVLTQMGGEGMCLQRNAVFKLDSTLTS